MVGNEQVNRNVNNFNQELSSVIGDLREYVNTSVFVSDCIACVGEGVGEGEGEGGLGEGEGEGGLGVGEDVAETEWVSEV